MISNSEMINVKNRSYGTVGYSLPEMGIKRKFQKNESKKISMEELRKLSYQPGGQFLINNSLIVENKEALKELNPDYEPEYFYTEDEVVKRSEKYGKNRNASRPQSKFSALQRLRGRFQISRGDHFGIDIAYRVKNILFFHKSISSFCKYSLSFLRVRKRSMLTALSFMPLPFAIADSG